MELSIFLAKLFGLYFLIAGVIVMYRQKSYMHIITEVMGSQGLLMVVGACQLVAGLALVIAHPIFTADWQGLITLIGVWIMVEGIVYMAAKHTRVMKWVRMFNNSTWFTSGGLLAVVAGAYLAGKGFGMW